MKSPLQPLTSGDKPKEVISFSHGELVAALLDVDDLMLRCTLSEDYLVLEETGRSIKEDRRLEGDGVDVGVLAKDMTEMRKGLMEQITKTAFEGSHLTYKVGQVPVRVHVLPNGYDFFTFKDVKVYNYEDFQLPNSFEAYWKVRQQFN